MVLKRFSPVHFADTWIPLSANCGRPHLGPVRLSCQETNTVMLRERRLAKKLIVVVVVVVSARYLLWCAFGGRSVTTRRALSTLPDFVIPVMNGKYCHPGTGEWRRRAVAGFARAIETKHVRRKESLHGGVLRLLHPETP